MKIKPKQKTVAAKRNPHEDPDEIIRLADEHGANYDAASQQEKEAKKRKDESNRVIKRLATDHGHRHNGEFIIKGKKYEVGFKVVETLKINADEVRKIVDQATFKKISKDVPAHVEIDTDKFQLLFEKGKINQTQVVKCITYGTPQKRIIVRKVKK